MIERKTLKTGLPGRNPLKTGLPGRNPLKTGIRGRNPQLSAAAASFLLTGILLTVMFVILGFYPFGAHTVINSDLSAQYAPDLIAYKHKLLEGGSLSYSFLIGMGKDTFGLFAYYLASPLNFITFLFPDSMISEAVLALISLKLALAGSLTALYLSARFRQKPGFACVFGVLYAFSSYAMVYMINIMWLDGFFLLPLLLFFIERYIEDGRRWKSIVLTLFVLFVSGFYIAYMVGIFAFLYLLARLYEEGRLSDRKSAVTVFLFLGCAVLAACLSAFILLPGGLDILGNPDHTAKSISLDADFTFVRFLDQLLVGSFDSLSNNKPLVYCGLPVLLLCSLFFMNPAFSRRQKGVTGGAILLFVFSFNLSVLNIAWHLFDSPNWFHYRNSFLFVFLLLTIAFASLINLKSLHPRAFLAAGILFFLLLVTVQAFGDLKTEGGRFYLNFFLGALELLCLYGMSGVRFPASIANMERLVPAILAAVICVETAIVNPMYIRPKIFGGEVERAPLATALEVSDDLVRAAKADAKGSGTSFYRIEADGGLLGIQPMNAGLYLGYPSVSTFNSSANKDLNRFLKQLGYDTNYNYFTSSHMYSSVVTDSLLGIRYILSESKSCGGYDLLARSDGGDISLFRNSQALPLLYLAEADAGSFDFYRLEKNEGEKNLFSFQDEWLVSLFGKAAFSESVYYEAEAADPEVYNAILQERKPSDEGQEGEEDSDSESTASADKDLLGVEPVGKTPENVETYLRVSDKDEIALSYSVTVSGADPLYLCVPAAALNDQADVFVNGKYTSEISSSAYTQIISLGSFDKGETVEVEIRADSDAYSVMPAQFYCCDTALFGKQLSAAMSGSVDIMDVRDGYVSAKAAAEEDRLLLTTIPYEKGWTLLIDGEKTKITPYQSALISVPLPAGEHTVVLSYEAPGQKAGAAVSLAAAVFAAGLAAVSWRKRRQTR